MNKRVLLFFFSAIFFWAFDLNAERRAPSGLAVRDFMVCGKLFHLEVADQDSSRQKGLMNRKNLDADKGMIFVFPDSKMRSFWMKNVLIPLDILFFDSNGSFVSGEHMTPDSPLIQDMFKKKWLSKNPAQFVVEVAGGTFKSLADSEDLNTCRLEAVDDFPLLNID